MLRAEPRELQPQLTPRRRRVSTPTRRCDLAFTPEFGSANLELRGQAGASCVGFPLKNPAFRLRMRGDGVRNTCLSLAVRLQLVQPNGVCEA